MHDKGELCEDSGIREATEGEGEGIIGTITPEEDALACPIIHMDGGKVSACLGLDCALWIEESDGLPGACGFKFLSMYARFEMSRMTRSPGMVD
jgi:hypothetical protein